MDLGKDGFWKGEGLLFLDPICFQKGLDMGWNGELKLEKQIAALRGMFNGVFDGVIQGTSSFAWI